MPQDQLEAMPQEDWYGEDVATFGDRLAAARDAAGMKRGEFAKRLGVKKSTVAAWEDDLSEPRANRLSMMAGLLNVSVGWLLTGEGVGVDLEGEGESAEAGLLAILKDIRDIRTRMKSDLDRLARLEKALRKKV
ncbi:MULTISPECIES: helix-turn-helix domain-containing protein [unclassified Shimia]|uniref:helix-turn-helix domain-containing protein n=1 Tax=unclassified Shimia TaxID=2630038 RepID=UPI001FFE2AD8|nr:MULTISPECIES: helix-turn-helix transcriptional regulator [unclassified Shimia]MDA5556127.1 helix-turn-helix transcriptional regulator [Shimia sp. MMG029]